MLMMFPFEAPTIFEGVHRSHFRMPRVVRDQKGKFENDDLFRQLSNESLVKYTAFKDRPLEERQVKFITGCQEGHTEISFTQSGNQFILTFNPTLNPAISGEGCDFGKEKDKVHIKSPFILNGVCVVWRGYIDLHRLDGSGCLEFDECRAYMEEHASKASLNHQPTINSNNSNSNNASNNNNSKLHQSDQLQPFNMLCNNSVNVQNNVAAAAALAAASAAAAANFHPDSPLSRYVNSQAPPSQLTPPHSQHNNSNHISAPVSASQLATPVSQHQHQNHNGSSNSHQNHQHLSGGMNGAPPPPVPPTSIGLTPVSSPQHSIMHQHQQMLPQHQHHSLGGPAAINSCLQGPPAPPPPLSAGQMTPAHLAAAMGAIQNGQGPPMSIADSYGNAAIAAAAAAAFHQALSASQQQQQHVVAAAMQQQHPGGLGPMSHPMGVGPNGPGPDFLAEMSHRQRAS